MEEVKPQDYQLGTAECITVDVYCVLQCYCMCWRGLVETYHGVGAQLHMVEKFGLITSLCPPCLLLLLA
jgi:hypothetical protein